MCDLSIKNYYALYFLGNSIGKQSVNNCIENHMDKSHTQNTYLLKITLKTKTKKQIMNKFIFY